jgi:hypothetical protein
MAIDVVVTDGQRQSDWKPLLLLLAIAVAGWLYLRKV